MKLRRELAYDGVGNSLLGIILWCRAKASLPALTKEAALAWACFFAPGRTFAIYVAHLEKAYLLFGVDSRLRTTAFTTASRRLARAGDESFCPRPAISKQQLVQNVATEGWGDACALEATISWTSLPRFLSECLPRARQRA